MCSVGVLQDQDWETLPSGHEKFDTHLWSSCSLEHLGQIQEICQISNQVVKCEDGKCGYLVSAKV